jgi:hypothetical protein
MFLELTLNDAAATTIYINSDHVVAVYRTPKAVATTVACVSGGGERRQIYAVRETPEEIAEEFA